MATVAVVIELKVNNKYRMFWRITEMLEAARLRVHPLYPPLAPMGPEVGITRPGPKSLPTNKMIPNITLMAQNYITSLNVGEQAI